MCVDIVKFSQFLTVDFEYCIGFKYHSWLPKSYFWVQTVETFFLLKVNQRIRLGIDLRAQCKITPEGGGRSLTAEGVILHCALRSIRKLALSTQACVTQARVTVLTCYSSREIFLQITYSSF